MGRKLVVAVLTALALAAPAAAGDIAVTLGFKAGSLGVRAPKAALGGTVQVPLTVVDARGSGAGWQLRLRGAGAPQVVRIAVRCAAGSTCTLPQGKLTTSGAGATLVAAPGTGMGAIELVATVSGGHGPLQVGVR